MSAPTLIITAAIIRYRTRMRLRRSSISAIAPATMPRKNRGAKRKPSTTPTINELSVSSRTSQPTTTCSPIKPMESKKEDAISRRKSRRRSAAGMGRRRGVGGMRGRRLGVFIVALLCTGGGEMHNGILWGDLAG